MNLLHAHCTESFTLGLEHQLLPAYYNNPFRGKIIEEILQNTIIMPIVNWVFIGWEGIAVQALKVKRQTLSPGQDIATQCHNTLMVQFIQIDNIATCGPSFSYMIAMMFFFLVHVEKHTHVSILLALFCLLRLPLATTQAWETIFVHDWQLHRGPLKIWKTIHYA